MGDYKDRIYVLRAYLLTGCLPIDRVQYVKLFRLLVKRGICPLTARLLAHMYTSQLIRVSWNGHVSNPFTTSNGVKQGAILSPILFCVYIDVLLLQLEISKFGCYIGSRFCGSFGYADDICILAPSRKATQSMLDICQKVASEYDIKFNVSKTQLLLINCPVNVDVISLNGAALQVSENGIHLGHPIGRNCNNDAINKGISDIVYRTNYVMTKFGFCNSLLRSHMFDTYCTSFYGCPLWSLRNNHIKRFYVNWRKCARKVWGVPRMTHGRILQHLIGGQGIEFQLLHRFLSFYFDVVHSKNVYVSMCGSLCRYSYTNAALSRRLLLSTLNNNGDCFMESSILSMKRKLREVYECSNECTAVGTCVKDLCLMKDGYYLPVFDQQNIMNMIYELCVN